MPRKTALVRDDLTPRQQLFVAEYLVDLNAMQACIRAGFSARTAKGGGAQLLATPRVAAAIRWRLDRRAERVGVTAERVLLELCRIGFANMADYTRLTDEGHRVPDISRCDRDMLAAVQEITIEEVNLGSGEDARVGTRTRLKLHGKREALLDIGKHLGMWGKGPRPEQIPGGAGDTAAAQRERDKAMAGEDKALLTALESTRQPKAPVPGANGSGGGTVH